MSLATQHTFAAYKKNNTIEEGDLVVLYLASHFLFFTPASSLTIRKDQFP
jgi:hypothetical protein